jgi:transposase
MAKTHLEGKMRKPYPSDVGREQYKLLSHYLETGRKRTHPRVYDLYDIFCAVLYVLREGCRWRSLPHDFPKWQNVYKHFKIWSCKQRDGKSILDATLEELVISERVIAGRSRDASMVIVDAKSVKNAFTARESGYDGGKKNNRYQSERRG